MTRVYENPSASPNGGTRAFLLGAGLYPAPNGTVASIPSLQSLTSVGPSVRQLVTQLIRDWRTELAAPLLSVDLLLSEPDAPSGSRWESVGVAGECPAGQPIDPPDLLHVSQALASSLAGSQPQDTYLFFCCGHGFWKTERYFILSDFHSGQMNPWQSVIPLETFVDGMRTKPPRTQWFFFDCCANIPKEVLNALGSIGTVLIQPNASDLSETRKTYGPLSMFGLSSASVGLEAFGNRAAPSRFTEMLLEALSGAGTSAKRDDQWWIHERGIHDAIRSYRIRTPNLNDAHLYEGTVPLTNDAPERMWFRRAVEPKSCLVVRSAPTYRLRNASIRVTQTGVNGHIFHTPQAKRAKLHLALPPRQHLQVAAQFPEGSHDSQIIFSDLPLAEPGQVTFKP